MGKDEGSGRWVGVQVGWGLDLGFGLGRSHAEGLT